MRREVAALRVVPAGQRLGRDHLHRSRGRRSAGTRSTNWRSATARARSADEREPVGVGGVPVAYVERDRLALVLRLVHRDVGAAQQLVDAGRRWRCDRDAGGRADLEPEAAELDRFGERRDQVASPRERVRGRPRVRSAGARTRRRRPGRDIGRALARRRPDRAGRRVGQPLRDRGQHLVADGLAERVVDLLELVEVQHDEPDQVGVGGARGPFGADCAGPIAGAPRRAP